MKRQMQVAVFAFLAVVPLLWINAPCEPSSGSTTDVETEPPVLYAQYVCGTVPAHAGDAA